MVYGFNKDKQKQTQKQFLQMKIQIPESPDDLETIVQLLDTALALRFQQETLTEKMKELHTSISLMLPH
jgi:hypothetical protein